MSYKSSEQLHVSNDVAGILLQDMIYFRHEILLLFILLIYLYFIFYSGIDILYKTCTIQVVHKRSVPQTAGGANMKIEHIENLTPGRRIFRFGAGMILITSVLAVSGPLGWAAVLPLLGIYPALTAFTGYCPVVAAIDESMGGLAPGKAIPA